MEYDRKDKHNKNGQKPKEESSHLGYVSPPFTKSELEKLLGLTSDSYHLYEKEFYSAITSVGMSSQGNNILDPRKPQQDIVEKIDLDNSWSKLALQTLTFNEMCEHDNYQETYCGSINTTVPRRLGQLLGVDEEIKNINVKFSLGRNEGDKRKTARLNITIGEYHLKFFIFSLNDGEMSRRIIFQRTEGATTGSVVADVNGVHTNGNDNHKTEYSEVQENYKSALELIGTINNWEKPDMCRTCPVYQRNGDSENSGT